MKDKICWIIVGMSIVGILGTIGYRATHHTTRSPEIHQEAELPTEMVEPEPQIIYQEKTVEVEKVITGQMIQDGLNDMGFLVTQEYFFTEVGSYNNEKRLILWITTDSELVVSYDGQILAGVDFEKIRVTRDDTMKTITITVPEAEMKQVSVDPDSFVCYTEKEGMGNPITAEIYNELLSGIEQHAVERAKDRGLLENAQKNAETVILNFINGLVDTTDYHVTIRQA